MTAPYLAQPEDLHPSPPFPGETDFRWRHTVVGPWAPVHCRECRVDFPPSERHLHVHPQREWHVLRAWDAAFLEDAWRDVEREFPDDGPA